MSEMTQLHAPFPWAKGFQEADELLQRVLDADENAYLDTIIRVYATDAKEFKEKCRRMGTFKKSADESYFYATREFTGGVVLQVYTMRQAICKRVVVGTEDVPEQVIPAVPEKIVPAYKKELVKWECVGSVLDNAVDPSIAESIIEESLAGITDSDIPF